MRDTDLFRMALGIEPPWVVRESKFDAAAKRLDVHLDFARGSRFACPECGVAGCPAYDSEEKTWRHLNFFQHQADRKSTRLNSSHSQISYAVFCLKKKNS